MAVTQAEWEHLRSIIKQWNENRLDLFALSEPTQDLEFHGVMRFYFQEAGQKVATKCIRVSSTATVRAVIDALVEKFHPDLRMLTTPEYSLWEVHENGEKPERKLGLEEKPLLVQLNWHKDDREGRFLLKRDGEVYLPLAQLQNDEANVLNPPSMKRKLSRREKKELKKQQKRDALVARSQESLSRSKEAEDAVAHRLYSEVPPTTFTRTISNPEIVMKKRRERKLQQKLMEMGEGGSLKVYGTDLSEEKPYVTLLVSNRDRAEKLVKETLEKYGLDRHDPADYCLVEALLPPSENENENTKGHVSPLRQRILEDDECPLLILSQMDSDDRSNVIFHVKVRPADMPRNKRKKQPRPSASSMVDQGSLPCFIQLNADGTDVQGEPKVIPIQPNVTEVGSDRALAHGQSLKLSDPYVHPRHCVLAYMDGVVTVTPCTPTAEIQINGHPIEETTILRNGFLVRIGRSHVYRFLEPNMEGMGLANMPRSQSMPSRREKGGGGGGKEKSSKPDVSLECFETTFDVDGTVETLVYGSDREPLVAPGRAAMPVVSTHLGARMAPSIPMLAGRDAIPAIIELLDNAEDTFLSAVIRDVRPGDVQFKLAPVYVLYASCRYRVSPHYRTSLLLSERLMKLNDFLTKTSNLLHVTVQDHCHDAEALAFWMANTSELLNFVKLDRDLGPATRPEPQESLADAVEKAFAHLTACLKQDLNHAMLAVLDPNKDHSSATDPCLHMLSGAMNLLRHCRVNAALTIQLFSQLFYHINMYLFNWLVSREGAAYCSRPWGQRFSQRLSHVQSWAYKQGLELAAECHLDKIIQAIKLLETPKTNEQLATLGGTCYKLNSVQVRSLLERYRVEPGEPPLQAELVDNVVKLAENQADETMMREGKRIQVEEEMDLQLPFLLPEDGYSPDGVRFIPSGLQEFVDSLLARGICRMIVQPGSSGSWTVHLNAPGAIGLEIEPATSGLGQMVPAPQQQPEVVQITFSKGDGGIGLSIVAAQGTGQPEVGIYIKKVVPGSAADKDGRLQAGDQLLKVNQQSLVGITQEEAAFRMAQSGRTVSFEVAKQAALYNGLATWLYQPSPDISQHSPAYRRQGLHQSDQSLAHPGQVPHQQFSPRSPAGHQRFASQSGFPVQRHQPEHSRSASVSHLEEQRKEVGLGVQIPSGSLRHPLVSRDYQNLHQYQDQQQRVQTPQRVTGSHVRQTTRNYGTPASIMSQSAEYPKRISPVDHTQAPRRPPSVDEAGLYRAHSAVQSSSYTSQSAFSGIRSPPTPQYSAGEGGTIFPYPTDYQNLPLQLSQHQRMPVSSPKVTVNPCPHMIRIPRPQLQTGTPRVQLIAPAQPAINGHTVHSQEPYRLPAAPLRFPSPQIDEKTEGSWEFQQPRTGHSSNQSSPPQVWAREEQEQREKEIDDEVIRLMREQADILEQKEFLTESEERRYRALKYELTYQERLKQEIRRRSSEDPGRRSTDDGNLLSELGEFQPAVSQADLMREPAAVMITPENRQEILEKRIENMEQNMEARESGRVEYFSRAEEKLREEAMRQRHEAELERLHQEKLSRAAMEAELERQARVAQAEEERLELARAEMHNLQTHMGNMSVEEEKHAPPVNGHLNGFPVHGAGKKPPPQVPPKRRVVFHESPPEILNDRSLSPPALNGGGTLAEMEQINAKYVYEQSDLEQPRTQILGAQEVYRDPRQERLHKLQQQQQAQKSPSVDGSNLDFKSKMRMFAKQLGEHTPNDRMKVSRAQRDIEDQLHTPTTQH